MEPFDPAHLPVVRTQPVSDEVQRQQHLNRKILEASSDGNLDDIRRLHAKGASVMAWQGGRTCGHLAASQGHAKVVAWLFEHGFPVNHTNREGDLLTHAAARENHLGVVQLLNDWGADWLRLDGEGRRAEQIAKAKGFEAVAELILSFGAEDNPQADQVNRELQKQLKQVHTEEVLRGRDYRPWEGMPHIPAPGDPVLSRQASRHLEALFWANTYVPSLVIAPAITNVVNQITETAMGNVVGRYGKREGGG